MWGGNIRSPMGGLRISNPIALSPLALLLLYGYQLIAKWLSA